MLKSPALDPERAMLEIVSGWLPVLVSVTVEGALEELKV
jgi:hypothetical protein